ncbi:MAG: hypothetical protein FWE01_01995 [Firmicutes bacterium]|nr:hypothetical protein [Bacillota bacterium]
MKRIKILIALGAIIILLAGLGAGIGLAVNREFVLTENDFAIVVSIVDEEFAKGEDIKVEILFKNLTNRKIRIVRSFNLVHVYIPGTIYDGSYPEIAINAIIRPNAINKYTKVIGSHLPVGEFELEVFASFSLRRNPHRNHFRIISNQLTIIVKEIE